MSQQLRTRLSYWPYPKQAVFHNDRYKIRYRAVFAAVGAGKTLAGCFETLSILLENPGCVAYIFEPTYKMVRRILIPTLEHNLLLGRPLETNPTVSSFRKGDNRIDFIDGQTLWFGSLEEPEYAEGPNVDVIQIDEAQYIRHFSEAWDVCLRRLRGSGRTTRTIQTAHITTTPPPLLPGDRLYEFFEDPETRSAYSRVYRWHLDDNIHLTEAYKREIKASHHGNLAKRFIEGKFAPAGIGSFDFDSTIHELPQPPSKDRVKEVVYGVDFGWTNPSAIVAVAFDGDDRAIIIDEFYQNRVQQEVLIEELQLMQRRHGEGRIYCDRSEPQAIDAFRKAGLTARPDKSRREDGIHELGGRFAVQKDKKPRIYVVKACVNWIHEVMVYDEKVKENDHAVDATRYALMGARKPKAWIKRVDTW